MPPGTDSFPRFQEEGEEGVTRQRQREGGKAH